MGEPSREVAFHGQPRFTNDLGVLVDPAPDNARRVLSALRQFGAGLSDLTESDLARPGIVFQIGVPPNRIDVLTSITSVDFAEAWAERVEDQYADQRVAVLGRRLLIKNKRAVGRPQDLLDADLLEG